MNSSRYPWGNRAQNQYASLFIYCFEYSKSFDSLVRDGWEADSFLHFGLLGRMVWLITCRPHYVLVVNHCWHETNKISSWGLWTKPSWALWSIFYEITFEGENYHTTTNTLINISFDFFLRHSDQDVIKICNFESFFITQLVEFVHLISTDN